MAPPRRAHRKSKFGCAECRRRRVKCDEARPLCSLCKRFQIGCVYPTPSLLPVQATASSLPSPAAFSSDLPSPPSTAFTPASELSNASEPITNCEDDGSGIDAQSPAFSIKDMALLHQWSVSTSLSIVHPGNHDTIWQGEITRVGLRQPFVLYAMLSISSLHKAFLEPGNKHTHTVNAAEYHNEAIRGFRKALNRGHELKDTDRSVDDHEDDKIAVFVFAALNIPYVFATYGVNLRDASAVERSLERIPQILGAEWIPLMRGVQTLLDPIYDTVHFSAFRDLVTIPGWEKFSEPLDATPEDAQDEQFLRLAEAWAHHGESDVETYCETLQTLRKSRLWAAQFSRMHKEGVTMGYNHEWSALFMWIYRSPERYFVRLREQQPPALLLFAYFGALLQELDHYWWVHGWAFNVVNVVDHLLGPYFDPWMEWPKMVVAAK